MSKRPSPLESDSLSDARAHKVIILDPKEKILDLQAQIDQLNQEKSHLMAQSISELRKQEAKTKALDSKVQRLVRQIDELDKEADDLMNTDNDEMKAAQDKRDELYKQLTISNAEVCKLRVRVSTLEEQLQASETLVARRGKDSHSQKVLCDASIQTEPETLTDMSIMPAPHVPLQPMKSLNLASEAIVLKVEDPMLPLSIIPYPKDLLAQPEVNPWFHKAFAYLDINLGREYIALVETWIEKERVGGFESPPTGLKKQDRPSELSAWQRKRFTKEPSISKDGFVESLSQEVWTWWISLQPSWRPIVPRTKPDCPPVIENDMTDWKLLDKKGLNGWFGLLVCLKWWGMGLDFCPVEQREAYREDWLRAISDMSAMLNGLLAYYQTSTS